VICEFQILDQCFDADLSSKVNVIDFRALSVAKLITLLLRVRGDETFGRQGSMITTGRAIAG